MHRVHFHKQTRTKSKYNSRSKEYNGKRYDSIKEANYAEELDWLVKAGEIQGWERQVKIDLKVNGKHICNYYIDFVVTDKYGGKKYIEVKGFETMLWKIKWKLCMALKNQIDPGAEWEVVK